MILNELLKNYTLVLGSASPRRQQLLSDLGLSFIVKTADIDEHAPDYFDGFETENTWQNKKPQPCAKVYR